MRWGGKTIRLLIARLLFVYLTAVLLEPGALTGRCCKGCCFIDLQRSNCDKRALVLRCHNLTVP